MHSLGIEPVMLESCILIYSIYPPEVYKNKYLNLKDEPSHLQYRAYTSTTHIFMFIEVLGWIHTHVYIHTYIHIYIYIYIYMNNELSLHL